ncbi:S9 family peptidase [Ruegeria sp. Alg231-54]|uniref:alpha/beta hydrolase family protein n=1 Tax=Ruegeria sp. Alg231-54 TaxID=1922221 RepID=UPI00131EF7CE|nr:alpha/beta fold hydrolase [Ruegeria sp. Alg231-54]
MTSGMALADVEEVVSISSGGQDFLGTMSRPDGDASPVVLLMHGFTGKRDELATKHVPAGVFGHTASRLADAGYASLRIDFRGSGESTADLEFAETTFEGQIQDGLAAIDYLKTAENVQGDEIYIIGWSQGGLVASAVAGRSDTPVAVALWNAVSDPQKTFGTLFGAEQMAEGMQAQPEQTVTVTLPWDVDIQLNGSFFDGIEAANPIAEIASYSGPLFVAQGSADTVVYPEGAQSFLEAHDGPETFWQYDMDHVFNIFTNGEALEQMIDQTIIFFEAQNSN